MPYNMEVKVLVEAVKKRRPILYNISSMSILYNISSMSYKYQGRKEKARNEVAAEIQQSGKWFVFFCKILLKM